MIALEQASIPTVSFTAKHFVADAEASALVDGLPELPLAVVEQTFTSQTAERIRSLVATAVEQVERGLTRRPAERPRGRPRSADREVIAGDDLLDCADRMNRLFVERGWSDGLPLVPPTPSAVERGLATTKHAGDFVVAPALYPGLGVATVEKIAINGVMAGCRPEHMPVLIALVRAYEGTGVLGKTQAVSTGPNAPLVLLSGPVIERLGFNYGTCVLGPGSPSYVNTVIGRALRLILMNVGQAYPGRGDMDTIGTPAKYSFCAAEHAARTPWETWNVAQGFDRDASTLSIALVYPGPDVYDSTATTPAGMLDTVATLTGGYIGTASVGRWLFGGRGDPTTKRRLREQNVLLLAPTHADLIRAAGWSRSEVAQYLHDRSRIPFKRLQSSILSPQSDALLAGHPELSFLLDQPETLVSIAESPDCYQVFVTGGDVGRSQFYYGGSEVSTVAIED